MKIKKLIACIILIELFSCNFNLRKKENPISLKICDCISNQTNLTESKFDSCFQDEVQNVMKSKDLKKTTLEISEDLTCHCDSFLNFVNELTVNEFLFEKETEIKKIENGVYKLGALTVFIKDGVYELYDGVELIFISKIKYFENTNSFKLDKSYESEHKLNSTKNSCMKNEFQILGITNDGIYLIGQKRKKSKTMVYSHLIPLIISSKS